MIINKSVSSSHNSWVCFFFQQPDTKNDASETEPEEGSEKKKKKKKKKKKPKLPTDVDKPQNESTTIQEPPRIEVQ